MGCFREALAKLCAVLRSACNCLPRGILYVPLQQTSADQFCSERHHALRVMLARTCTCVMDVSQYDVAVVRCIHLF